MKKNKQYDIGILTFWNVPNYGTFAQAYALQNVLKILCPERKVIQIAYLNKRHYNSYYSILPKCAPWHIKFYKDLVKHINPFSKYNKRKKMFLESYLEIPHTELMTKRDFKNTKFQRVFLGSDIIWDFSFRIFDNDPYLFGVGINTDKLYSYAASFGTIKLGQGIPNYIKEGIKEIDEISVRDKMSAAIVESIIHKKPALVLDPTWLWDFNLDPKVVKPQYDDYMIVYGQDFSDRHVQQIVDYAKSHNLMLICLDCNDDNYTWCDLTIKQFMLSPFEWIGYFKYATTIATTTFHGLTFSLIFNKKFAFCKTSFIMDKAGDFLKEIQLYDLFNSDDASIADMINYDWNYEYINSVIDSRKKESYAFLTEASKL